MIDDVMSKWINPIYLDQTNIFNIQQSMLAKPYFKYAVLDNFFNVGPLTELLEQHDNLQFSEQDDRSCRHTGQLLPYDGSVVFADKTHIGSDLFFNSNWHNYLCYLSNTELQHPIRSEIKLRYHKPEADGFWIHTDSTIRDLVIICYFNHDWKASDGGLLQLWRIDEELSNDAINVETPIGRLDVLNNNRINTVTPGGGFRDNQTHDLVLIDQIVPGFNRVFICSLKNIDMYHSVTPSNGKPRTGFVQWLMENKNDQKTQN